MFQTCLLDACLLGKDLAVANKGWMFEFKNNTNSLRQPGIGLRSQAIH